MIMTLLKLTGVINERPEHEMNEYKKEFLNSTNNYTSEEKYLLLEESEIIERD